MATEVAEIVTDTLTPAESRHFRSLENRIERGLQTFREVGEALMEVRDSRLYRQAHATFEDYCRVRWGLDRNRAYQLIGAAEVVKVVGGKDGEGPVNEAQARELVALAHENPDAAKEVWKEVTSRGVAITAPMIREVVQAHTRAPEADPGPTPTEALVNTIQRLGTQYTRWLATKPSRRDKSLVMAALEKLDSIVGD